jgi:putative salt-induced outer membrane protein
LAQGQVQRLRTAAVRIGRLRPAAHRYGGPFPERRDRCRCEAGLTDGTAEEDFILRGGINYQWKFSEFAQFTQDFTAESGPENIYSESVSAIKTRLVGALALVASYTIRNNSVVPLGSENTDTFAAVTIEYAF